MKILLFSDLHADSEWFNFVATRCADCDLLVFAGDLMNQFSRVPYRQQARTISKWLRDLKAPAIAVASGHHDWWVAQNVSSDANAEGKWIKNLRGKGRIVGVDGDFFKLGGVTFLLRGWLGEIDPFIQADVLITHAPPSQTPTAIDETGKDLGIPDVTGGWKLPRLILCGQVHAPRSYWCKSSTRESTVLNPGCDEESSTPLHWIVDTEAGVATHSTGRAVNFGALK
jgi:Icc-related predicted phosphoesterase